MGRKRPRWCSNPRLHGSIASERRDSASLPAAWRIEADLRETRKTVATALEPATSSVTVGDQASSFSIAEATQAS
jgi:hypothetical protein